MAVAASRNSFHLNPHFLDSTLPDPFDVDFDILQHPILQIALVLNQDALAGLRVANCTLCTLLHSDLPPDNIPTPT